MQDQKANELDPNACMVRRNKYIPDTISDKQRIFLLVNEILEVFFGGAGGGGKSIALLQGALQYVDYPEYRAIIFRRTYKQLSLPGGLLDVSQQWLNPYKEIGYTDYKKSFVFPSGAILTFGHLDAEKDKYNYQSAEFHYIGIDEITDFTETQAMFLFSRLRKKADCPIPLRFRSASNPVGPGFKWVKGRYITNGKKNGRLFIPSRLSDNPYIDQSSYIESLNKLDPITREKILNGDWDVREESVMFKLHWFKLVKELPPGVADSIRVWDFAGTKKTDKNDPSFTVGWRLNRLYDGRFCFSHIVRFQGSPKQVEDAVKNTAVSDGKYVDIFIEQEPGSSGKMVIDHYVRNVLLGYTVNPVSPTGPKEIRARPLASYTEKGDIIWVESAFTEDVRDEFLTFPLGKKDVVDSAAHAFNIMVLRPMPTNSAQLYDAVYQEKKKLLKS